MKRAVLHNLGWKLLALGVAVLLWATFVGSPELVTSIYAPIEYENMPQTLELSSGLPERVYLEVQGPSARLHSLDLSRAAVVLNLGTVNRAGEHTFTIERHNIDLPAGLKLVRIVPTQVRLEFDRRLVSDVPVKVRFAGAPPAGYRIASQEVAPPRLRIIGPESRVRQIAFAETDPIDLSHVIGTAEVRVHVLIADPQVRLVSSPVVLVRVSLEKTAQNSGGPPSDGQAVVRH